MLLGSVSRVAVLVSLLFLASIQLVPVNAVKCYLSEGFQPDPGSECYERDGQRICNCVDSSVCEFLAQADKPYMRCGRDKDACRSFSRLHEFYACGKNWRQPAYEHRCIACCDSDLCNSCDPDDESARCSTVSWVFGGPKTDSYIEPAVTTKDPNSEGAGGDSNGGSNSGTNGGSNSGTNGGSNSGSNDGSNSGSNGGSNNGTDGGSNDGSSSGGSNDSGASSVRALSSVLAVLSPLFSSILISR